MASESPPSRNDAPHVPAAFINAIAEEGTKAEAIEWLQKTWNELCRAESELRALRHDMERAQHNHAADLACAGSEIPCCGETPCQWGDHPCERKKVPASPSDKPSAAEAVRRMLLDHDNCGELLQATLDYARAALACAPSAEQRSGHWCTVSFPHQPHDGCDGTPAFMPSHVEHSVEIKQAVKLAHGYLSLGRTLISGDEISLICRALMRTTESTVRKP